MIMHHSLPSMVVCARWSSQALEVPVKVGVTNSAAPSHICLLLSKRLHNGHSDDFTCWHAAAITLFGPRPASTGVCERSWSCNFIRFTLAPRYTS